jgi:hypothetical protein
MHSSLNAEYLTNTLKIGEKHSYQQIHTDIYHM